MATGLERVLAQATFVGLRMGMVMVFAPFFGGPGIPARVKLGLTVALAVLLYPGGQPARFRGRAYLGRLPGPLM